MRTANPRELSPNELDQVTGGHRGSDVIPALLIGAAALPIVGALVAGVLRSIFGSE
jgi:hypothetical protein